MNIQQLPVPFKALRAWLRMGLGASALAWSAAALGQSGPSFPVEPGWKVLDRAELQKLEGALYSSDKLLNYRLDLPNKQLTMTRRVGGNELTLSLSIRENGQIDDSEGGRSVIQAKGDELRNCAVDEPLTCWPLHRPMTAEEADQSLKQMSELALQTCGRGKVHEVKLNRFSCKP